MKTTEILSQPQQTFETTSQLERQRRLQETLDTIKKVSRLVGKENFSIRTIAETADIKEDSGIYVLDKTLRDRAVRDVGFEFTPKLLSGVADSAHVVVAGELSVDFDNDESHTLTAAAKCFYKRTRDDRVGRAIREVVVMEDMQRRGELTMNPLAVAFVPESYEDGGEVIVLTEYDPNLLTLDNYPWGRGATPAAIELAKQAAHAVGRFNTFGYVHGDAKIKNIAQSEDDGRVGMIDYETCKAINIENPSSVMDASYIDFGLFLSSLKDKGLFSGDHCDPQDVVSVLGQSYLSAWSDHDLDIQSAALSGVIGSVDSIDL